MLIKHKLPLVIVLLVSISLILSSLIVSHESLRYLEKISKNRIIEARDVEKNVLEALIYGQKKEAELLANCETTIDLLKAARNIGGSNKENFNSELVREAGRFLTNRIVDFKEIESCFIADDKGKILAGTDRDMAEINISDRQYFSDALKGKVSLSNVIKSKLDNNLVIVVAAPIRDETGKVLGVLGNVLNIDYFRQHTDKVKIDETGYAFLVDSEGIIISHRVKDKIGKPVENDITKELVARLKRGEAVSDNTGDYKYDNVDKYMGYCVIKELNWILAVTQEKSEVNGAAYFILSSILLFTLLVIIISTTAAVKFSTTITQPIHRLIATMKKAEEGELDAKCEHDSRDELGELSRSFNVMLAKLNLGYEELTAVYEELSATEEELRAQYDELQHNEEVLRNSEEKYRLALDGANDAIWEWDLETKEFFASDKWTEITGYPVLKTIGLKTLANKIIHPEDADTAVTDFKDHLEGRSPYYKSEFRIKAINGEYKWVFNRGKALRDSEGKPTKLAGSLTDISERKKYEENIRFMAYYDSLTRLPNRTFFIQELNKALEGVKKNGNSGAVFFIDLDDFKKINDTLGHDYGDLFLGRISEYLEKVKGEHDTVCRFGGDEFLILQPEVSDRRQVVNLAKDIMKIFEKTFELEEKQLYITGSIGITLFPEDGTEPSVILKNADTAMYRAKDAGKNNFAFYDKSMYDTLERKIKIEKVLRDALEKNELEIYYQPQFDIQTNEIAGFEALLRLKNKELGFVSPAEFIPVAEETGLIVPIGKWVLANACKKNKEWQDKGYKQYCISVNISSAQLQQRDFLDMVKETLEKTGLPPQCLELEITESILMKSVEENVKTLGKLREIGVRIALDDFGTGYSSLSYLIKIPLDTLKIDKSFIDGICMNPAEEAIAEGIIQLAHKMNLGVVSEGVEEPQQLKLLFEKRCDKVQGYLFSRPIPSEQVEDILNRKD